MTKKRQNRKSRSKKDTLLTIADTPIESSVEADTAYELVEFYEAVERSYRASVMAGETFSGVAQSTNY
jgi:hypothetical protein